MQFEIIGKIESQETFPTGKGIRELARLQMSLVKITCIRKNILFR